MAEYLIQDTTLTAIANAVRAKTKKSDAILVSDLAEEINQIPLGGDSSETYGYTLFLTVVSTPGTEVTLSNGEKSYTKNTDTSYNVVFNGLEAGVWTATAVDAGISTSIDIDVPRDMTYKFYLTAIPSFTYDGDYLVVNDNDEPIDASPKDWKIKFLTSGTLNFTNLNGAADGIDVFLVGGGGNGNTVAHNGGGGAGGYTLTEKGVNVSEGTYSLTVGGAAGKTTAFGFTANPGGAGRDGGQGGNGGSGGGAAGKNGGSNGNKGGGNTLVTGVYTGGTGQGTTTREFGESTGTLYAGGGGGSWCWVGQVDPYIGTPGSGGSGGGGNGTKYDGSGGTSGAANTGGGGGGGAARAQGGSGIVIIRNKR